ncbi:MAG: Globin-coupled histidine kinase [candidate division BRC1 bacterium ADurb.BinA364]|nr:MAG: Globin-coupled histidine kinase [candidate division BRC1 bacterium ADurb.BinA364]
MAENENNAEAREPAPACPVMGSMSIHTHLALSFIAVAIVAMGIASIFYYYKARWHITQALRRDLLLVAQTAATQLDGDMHERIGAGTGADDPDFQAMRNQLIEIKKANSWPHDICTFRLLPSAAGAYSAPQSAEYVVTTQPESYAGKSYIASDEMRMAYEFGEARATNLYRDEQGRWISAYAPIMNSRGEVAGLLAVDYDAHDYYAAVSQEILQMGVIALGVLALCGLLAIYSAKRVSAPVESLTHAVETMAAGDYDTSLLSCRSIAELNRLAESFERMRMALKERLADLHSARTELLRSERLSAVGRLAHTIVHDLKNPMQVIKVANAVLAEKSKEELHPQMISRIASSIRRMADMTGDILDFCRDELRLETEMADLADFIEDEMENFRLSLKGSPVRLTVEPGQSALVEIDRNRLARAFGNLIANAAEALAGRPDGRIDIQYGTRDSLAFLRIIDNGPGIPEAIRHNLFESFVTHGKANGTGLGTSICKRVVEAHGGTIDFTTETNRGTAFEIALPLATQESHNGARPLLEQRG